MSVAYEALSQCCSALASPGGTLKTTSRYDDTREDDSLSRAIAAEKCGLYGKAITLLEEVLHGDRLGNERRAYSLLLLGTLMNARAEVNNAGPYLTEALGILENEPALSTALRRR